MAGILPICIRSEAATGSRPAASPGARTDPLERLGRDFGDGSRPPAIVLGGHIPALAVIRGLGRMGVPVIVVWSGRRQIARTSSHVLAHVKAPSPEHAEDEYVDLLIRLVERTGPASLVVPTSDSTLGTVARNKAALEARCRVACVEWEVAERFLDKRLTYRLAHEVSVPAPQTHDFRSLEEVEAAKPGLIYPCVVKPRESHRFYTRFRKKMTIVHTYGQLVEAWSEATDHGFSVLVQDFIPGPDTHGVNYNAYLGPDGAAVEATSQKLRLSPPRTGFPRVVVTKPVPEILEPARRLLQAMGFQGFANVEFKLDARDGTYKLMEVNGRHNFSGMLSLRAGINFPWIMYRHLVDHEPPPRDLYQRTGVYWIRLPCQPIQSLRELMSERPSPRHFLLPYAKRHVFDILEARDPKPFLANLGGAMRAQIRALPGSRKGRRPVER